MTTGTESQKLNAHIFIPFSPFGEESNTTMAPFVCINISSNSSFQRTNSILYFLTFPYKMVRMTESVDISMRPSSPTFILLPWFLRYHCWQRRICHLLKRPITAHGPDIAGTESQKRKRNLAMDKIHRSNKQGIKGSSANTYIRRRDGNQNM
jgi:hypothetical protein